MRDYSTPDSGEGPRPAFGAPDLPPVPSAPPPPPFNPRAPMVLAPPPSFTIYQVPPARHIAPASPTWAPALVAACLALGFALSWVSLEVRLRMRGDANLQQTHTGLTAVISSQDALGKLMADPRTRLVKLTPVDDAEQGVHSPIRRASVAWNDDQQSGVFFCDGVPLQQKDIRFELWLVTAGKSTGLTLPPVEAGRTVYPFHPQGRAPMPSEIVVTGATSASDLGQAGPALARGTVEGRSPIHD